MKKVDKVLVVIIILCCLLSIHFCLMVYFTTFHHRLEYKEYQGEQMVYFDYPGEIPTKEDVIIKINKLTNTNYKIRYDESFLGGRTTLYGDLIYLHPKLEIIEFARIYAHEIYHHIAFTHNDLYVEFETFKFLFNSGDPFLRYSALIEAVRDKFSTEQYDARYYIYKYLNEIGFDIHNPQSNLGGTE